jgi:hypothetical protein
LYAMPLLASTRERRFGKTVLGIKVLKNARPSTSGY